MEIMRRDKHNYYLDIAQMVGGRSTCLRRKHGAIIVRADEVIATGYNGAPRKTENCVDRGTCVRQEMDVPSGERYELCVAVHAEMNAIISAARRDMIGGVLYLVGFDAETGEILEDEDSCLLCKRLIINAGIAKVVIRRGKENYLVVDVQEKWVDKRS
jgi:dCMP deaminase